jgi:hypothetical protein
VENLDFIGVNAYPGTWDATPQSQMLTVLSKSYTDAVAAFPSKLVLLTETGTPYAGDSYTPPGFTTVTQTPSESKAASYLDGFLDYVHTQNIPAFYFEAYDEPIKSSQAGGHKIEQYFGLMDGNMQIHPFYQASINKYINATIRPYNTTNITLHPNPVSDVVSIKGLLTDATVTIMDVSGKIIRIYENAPETIDVSYLPKGVYFVKVNEEVLKLIKN